MGQKAFYFDMTRCSGCRCCQVACKEAHDLPVGVFFRRVQDFEGRSPTCGRRRFPWDATTATTLNA